MERIRYATLALALALAAAPLSGQTTSSAWNTRPQRATSVRGPSLGALSVAAHAPRIGSLETTAAPDDHAGLGRSKAMMVVGGAALITGAVIGGTPGTLIMIGGAIVGLFGLYEYLQ